MVHSFLAQQHRQAEEYASLRHPFALFSGMDQPAALRAKGRLACPSTRRRCRARGTSAGGQGLGLGLWEEFGIEYDEGAEGIDEPSRELNGDGEISALGLTDTPADSERSLLLKTLQRRRDHCPPAIDASTAANEYSISMQPPSSTNNAYSIDTDPRT